MLSSEEAKNSLLAAYFDREYAIERTYGKIHEYHRSTGRYPDVAPETYQLFSFFASLVLVHERLTKKGQQRLQTNIRDGLQDAKGLAPLAAELRTATHLMHKGYDIKFTDIEGLAQFDLLATREDVEVEVDCKAPSGDVGRKVHSSRFRALAGRLGPAMAKIVDSGNNYLVMVTVPTNLHGDRTYEDALIQQIDTAIRNMAPLDISTSVASISITEFRATDMPFERPSAVTEASLLEFLKKKLGLENVNAAFRWGIRKGAAILVVKSAGADKVVDGIYRQLKSSAETQFSGRRPAMLCVQLRDFDAVQLRNLAHATPNGLELIAGRLFSSDHRTHLAGVSFVALERAPAARRFQFGDLLRTSYQDIGAAYVFSNPKHPAADVVGTAFR